MSENTATKIAITTWWDVWLDGKSFNVVVDESLDEKTKTHTVFDEAGEHVDLPDKRDAVVELLPKEGA